jgi:penicillin-binding protein 2
VIAAVRDAMISVVSEGTGIRAKLEGVQVAGKTGSAQVVTHARLETNKHAREYQPHGWFVCFAPAENPKVAMVVMVEHGTGRGDLRGSRGRPDPLALLRGPRDRARA